MFIEIPTSEPKHYANITTSGEMDEQTDPSVDHDGYLKKTMTMFGYKKKKKGKENNHYRGKRQGENNGGVTEACKERPMYGNEVGNNENVATRKHSMPHFHAPSPPSNNSTSTGSTYAEGRVGGYVEGGVGGYAEGRVGGYAEDRVGGYSEGRVGGYSEGRVGEHPESTETEDEDVKRYVNLQNQTKGEPVFNVAPKKAPKQYKHIGKTTNAKKDQMYVNDIEVETKPSDSSEQRKMYENLDNEKYSNLKGDGQGKVDELNDDVLSQGMYENVDKEEHDIGGPEQDDLYEET